MFKIWIGQQGSPFIRLTPQLLFKDIILCLNTTLIMFFTLQVNWRWAVHGCGDICKLFNHWQSSGIRHEQKKQRPVKSALVPAFISKKTPQKLQWFKRADYKLAIFKELRCHQWSKTKVKKSKYKPPVSKSRTIYIMSKEQNSDLDVSYAETSWKSFVNYRTSVDVYSLVRV